MLDYKQMYREDLSCGNKNFLPIDRQAIESFETYWLKASEESYHRLVDVRIARKIWAGIGLVVFGKTEYLEETLRLTKEYPNAIRYPWGKVCLPYLPAIMKLEDIPPLFN